MTIDEAIAAISIASSRGQLSSSAVENIRRWLLEPPFANYAPVILEHVGAGKWRELDDAFWTSIPFGTAGRRGKMYPIGTNAINERTIGESVQGLADYILSAVKDETSDAIDSGLPATDLACAIAYDTRHRSREFAELCAEVLVAAGFKVLFFDDFRPTPELSFTVRDQHCSCGIMISASHNPPSDNAIKVFWSSGVQLRPPHDAGVIECVSRVTEIHRVPFGEAVAADQIHFCQDEQDSRYREAVLNISSQRISLALLERDEYTALKVLYSPLHGVGLTSIPPILLAAGFTNVEIYQPHAIPDGDFPNVPDQIANPENPAVFEALIARAEITGADLILASDPDADRIGCAAKVEGGRPKAHPLTPSLDRASLPPSALHLPPWRTLTGNQIGVLLGEYLLRRLQAAGKLTPQHYVVKTLVTSDMICRVAEAFGVRAFGSVLTGFKWIGGLIDEVGPDQFVLGFEEAHGYLAGTYTRDKDGAVAAMLLTELAAECKAAGKTLHEHLDELFVTYGCHLERTVSRVLPGADGVAQMTALMQRLRTAPPLQLGGLPVQRMRDYLPGFDRVPPSDLLIFDLSPSGNRAAVRPSGTEPKLKFYLFTCEPPCRPDELPLIKQRLQERLSKLEVELLSV